MKNTKRITAAISVLAAFALAACSAQPSEDTSAPSESETISEASSETVSETTSETKSETEAETEEEISETEISESETAEEESTTEAPADELPYELDPEFTFPADATNLYELMDTTVNKPMLAASPEGTGAELYVMYADESRAWTNVSDYTYDEPTEYPSSEYVIIAHDGIADEIQYNWSGRFGASPEIYSGDYDGDGVNEIASVNYVSGGTYCNINELVIYDLEDGHYVPYIFYHKAYIDQDFSEEINNEAQNIRFKFADPNICYDSDIFYDMDTSELGSIGGVSYLNAVEFNVQGNSITMMLTPLLSAEGGGIAGDFAIDAGVVFKDGVYSLNAPVFDAERPMYG